MRRGEWQKHTCPVCGKAFDATSEHRYRMKKNSRWVKVCSWKCQRAWEAQEEPKEKPKGKGNPRRITEEELARIVDLRQNGASWPQIAKLTGRCPNGCWKVYAKWEKEQLEKG